LEHLESLDLSQNPISDVSSLAEFESLKVLNIGGTKVVNLDPLKDLLAAGLRVKKD
jgi:Leucine-rich repeat (LRR) protein